eukprot:243175-Amphidinium_carterae.1
MMNISKALNILQQVVRLYADMFKRKRQASGKRVYKPNKSNNVRCLDVFNRKGFLCMPFVDRNAHELYEGNKHATCSAHVHSGRLRLCSHRSSNVPQTNFGN